jgi:peptidoglycan/LPS O-acetylase OafA/YrhL
MPGTISRPDLPVLTSLRFFAAGVVVLHHLDVGRLTSSLELVRGWAQSGYEAVTFFFVLSGFILVYVYSAAREQDGLNVPPRRFLIARLARIGPAYYLGLLLMLPSFLYGSLVAGLRPEHFPSALVLVPTLLQAWYPPVSFSWNGPAWSLSVELFFYALFPLLMLKSVAFSRGKFLIFASGAVVATAALRLHISSLVGSDSVDWEYFILYFPLFHLPSFVFGMALGRIYLFGQKPSPAAHRRFFLFGAAALALLLGYRGALPPWLLTDALLVPLYGTVIFGAARMEGYLRTALTLPALVLLGEASYSIYILHTAVVFWWHWIAHKLFVISLPETTEILIVFGLVISLSIWALVYFERPLRRRILQYSSRPAKVTTVTT